jgi:hypothetical protein
MTPRPGKIPVQSFRVSTRSVPRFEVTADARPPPRARRRVPPPPRARSTLNLSLHRFRSSPRAHRVRARVPTPPRAVAKSRGRVASDSVAAPRRAFSRVARRAFSRDLRRERPRFVSFRSLAKSRARIERSERRARRRRVSRARPAVRAPRRLHRGSRPVDARGPREMDRAVESRFVVRGGVGARDAKIR